MDTKSLPGQQPRLAWRTGHGVGVREVRGSNILREMNEKGLGLMLSVKCILGYNAYTLLVRLSRSWLTISMKFYNLLWLNFSPGDIAQKYQSISDCFSINKWKIISNLLKFFIWNFFTFSFSFLCILFFHIIFMLSFPHFDPYTCGPQMFWHYHFHVTSSKHLRYIKN